MKKLILSGILLGMGACLSAQSLKYQGYPSREGEIDLRSHFANPPKGYGNVPFYWWDGDTLKLERLLDQLSILSEASTDGLSVSYIHTHPEVDVEVNAHGYGGFGKADAGVPGFYTEEWWKLWNRFSGECAKKGIGLGVDDYVVGWVKNGYYVDEVWQDPEFSDYQGRLQRKCYAVKAGDELSIGLPPHTLSVTAYPGQTDLTPYVKDGVLKWMCRSEKINKVYVISTTPSPELHPRYGERLVEVYFNRFEERLDAQGREGMNYFFQDELHYDANLHSWSEDMRDEFKRRKGYDVLPYLPALWDDIGTVTPKIRLDYAQVVTELAEERYFKPIFDWHHERGLIYGCDNNGRGLEPLHYMDYFRAISWFTAPGNDAPARGSSFRQTKVSSSITHLYKRPRTWLEAFHSMGWDSNGEWLTSQLDHHLIAGGNLLCLHGLYYSTHGGWWEWAPPCFHFRMPYWPHMKRWLKYAERMSFVLSQGTHVCDIAVMYPTEAMQAYGNMNLDSFWRVTDELSACGLDYDYMDYQSLQQAKVKKGRLCVADEEYKVLLLVNMKAMHYETLQKIYEFYKSGGIVLAVGDLPQATSRTGEKDARVERILRKIFSGKGIHESDAKAIPQHIRSLITPDFQAENREGKVLHRKVGNQDVYMVMNVSKSEELFFRSWGKVECWAAWDGSISEVPVLKQTDEGTWIRHDAEYNESKLYVFSPGEPLLDTTGQAQYRLVQEIPVDGEWDVEMVPTLNNKWGDFRLPAMQELIGVEAREFDYQFVPSGSSFLPQEAAPTGRGVYGYAPYMETVTLPASVSLSDCLPDGLADAEWKPYCYSWQYGVFDNPGGQGYHGLKGKVDNRFIILDQGGHQLFRTFVYAPCDGNYRMEQEGEAPDHCYLDGKPVDGQHVTLQKGWHRLLLAYANTPKGSYVLEEKKSYSVDPRKRSALVFYPAEAPAVPERHPYSAIVAMKWYQTDHLAYSVQKDDEGLWAYQFQTAPGTRTLDMELNGEPGSLWVDGRLVGNDCLKRTGGKHWTVDLDKYHTAGISVVTLTARATGNGIGPALFAEPVKMQCQGGRMKAGNWTLCGALKFYSGGIRYARQLTLPDGVKPDRVVLDLGSVNATCEVLVNGKPVDVLMHTPYRLDIGDYLHGGSNRIEVLVYSTLSNHYQTIPSAYRGQPVSGLLGPVRLQVYRILNDEF